MVLTWKSKNEFNESNVTFGMLTTHALKDNYFYSPKN